MGKLFIGGDFNKSLPLDTSQCTGRQDTLLVQAFHHRRTLAPYSQGHLPKHRSELCAYSGAHRALSFMWL